MGEPDGLIPNGVNLISPDDPHMGGMVREKYDSWNRGDKLKT